MPDTNLAAGIAAILGRTVPLAGAADRRHRALARGVLAMAGTSVAGQVRALRGDAP